LSRHYNPYPLKDAAQHPFYRSWRAALERSELTVAWLSSRMKARLEWFMRLGVRPTAATILKIQDAQPAVPTAGEIGREFGRICPQTPDADLFPNAIDRYRANLEGQLSAVRHRSAS